jgi:hypothetical protein
MGYFAVPPHQYRGPQQYPSPPVYYYGQPYTPGAPMYAHDPAIAAHQRSESPAFQPVRPANEASYQRIRATVPPPPLLQQPPAKLPERKPRMTQPPPAPAKQAPPKQQPLPSPPPKARVDSSPIVLPQKPPFKPDFTKAPGCFDIVSRGSLPRISFATEIVF